MFWHPNSPGPLASPGPGSLTYQRRHWRRPKGIGLPPQLGWVIRHGRHSRSIRQEDLIEGDDLPGPDSLVDEAPQQRARLTQVPALQALCTRGG